MPSPRKTPPSWQSSVVTATAILHSRSLRRQVMFVGMIIVMVQVFLGAVPLDAFLLDRPVLMLIYWLSCFFL